MTSTNVTAVLLDRDGVINENRDDYVTSWEQFRFLPGSLDALVALRARGLRVAVCTNQSAVGRGLLSSPDLDEIHTRMLAACERAGAAIDAVLACRHAPWEGCVCRKPRPGLLLRAMAALGVEPESCIAVGDSRGDMSAARTAGVPFVFVRTGRGERTLRELAPFERPAHVAHDLREAATHIMSGTPPVRSVA